MELEEYKAEIRQRLLDTDYTQLSDVMIDNAAEFVDYRQFLRFAYKLGDVNVHLMDVPEPVWTVEPDDGAIEGFPEE